MGASNASQFLPKRNRRQEKKIKDLPPRVGRRLDPKSGKVDKYRRYRDLVGRPLGPGVPGAKAGRNRATR